MFPKKSPPASPLATPKPQINAMSGASFSVFAGDTLITGNVSASADLHIDGRIEGDIACAGLVQGESSEIVGEITAQTARLAGVVRGTINVGALVILKSARIHGDVQYETLTIEQGARVDGRFAVRGELGVAVAAGITAVNGEPKLMLAN
ncbi:MAG: hypothetical protein RLY97_1887 [Pseudomonadota bacterium]|jgi:cytoskeletal protein CcmA (bactofilin family)